jgi:hypothetical protein
VWSAVLQAIKECKDYKESGIKTRAIQIVRTAAGVSYDTARLWVNTYLQQTVITVVLAMFFLLLTCDEFLFSTFIFPTYVFFVHS